MTSGSVRRWLALIVLSAGLLLAVSLWFRAQYQGWFGASIPNVEVWGDNWQHWVDRQPLDHPAMIHLMPAGCLCRFFTVQHASALSEQARALGYSRYQGGNIFLSSDLAVPLETSDFPASPGPLLALTDSDGSLRYLGPYSDGLRCTSANSLVDDWLPLSRPGQLLQVDANSCQCDNFGLTTQAVP
jgi:hypothetical protein